MAEKMLGFETASYLIPHINCTSDTEEDEDGNLFSIQSNWRHQKYSLFLHILDTITINSAMELKGKNSVNRCLESQRIFGGNSKEQSACIVLKDETNHTAADPQNISNSVCSASQRAIKSVGIATPTCYANLVAARAKKGNITDENGFTVITINSETQTSGERHCEFDYFKNKINKLNEKVKFKSHQIIFKTATTAPKEI
ncbi:hypothetical protein BY996DRAFT_6578666 [Phakopsora pachyrhizi]|nr:hypothetical protein BY996DRAFT_6578666 [Phakopsora pachyrhizi]